METPYTDHLTAADYEQVYEAAEDTFLLLDALEADLPYLEGLQPLVCLEIGPGSGIIVTALAKKLNKTLCLATDINSYACKMTRRTANRNCTHVDSINCNLMDALREKCIDLLIFNPPYVVTTDEEFKYQSLAESQKPSNLVYSWAGGLLGRRVVDELIKSLDGILSVKGVFYLLTLHENKPDELMQDLTSLGFIAIKFMERRIPGEYLYVLKITRR
ncbi:methyltransferase N6AMT1-like [Rhagoletis pomonella]|uniref:methyltransferase N6AMT1-like n=1 Tax=Rhagoletis pomonella TaxID=28610 RepID=UPI0017814442|nr:methyltransferase N6AMT1-like [Rhagoletis pomonella]